METITGIDIYPLFSLLVFFIFFTALIIVVMRTRKSRIDEIASMPLDIDEPYNIHGHE
jgi:hypothetical protein